MTDKVECDYCRGQKVVSDTSGRISSTPRYNTCPSCHGRGRSDRDMTDNNDKVEPMGIDELIKELHKLPPAFGDSVIRTGAYVEAFATIVGYILNNRTRLEAGMAKPQVLRFKIQYDVDTYTAFVIPDNPGEAPYLVFGRWGNEQLLRNRCENFARAIKMQAEFVDTEDNK